MAEPWIRVHANVAQKPVVWRAAEALKVSPEAAVGLLVTFWGAVSQYTSHGAVAKLPDAQLEAWAGWRGKRGVFAAFVRANHLDADGRVNEWDEYAGALEERKEKDRRRKRRSRGSHADIPEDETGTSGDTRRDDTIRGFQHLQQLDAEAVEAEAGLAVMLESDADRNALTVVVARAQSPLSCLIAFQSMLTGNDPATQPAPSPGVFGEALRDMAANGEKPSAKKFRNYLDKVRERVARSVPPSGAGATSATGARRENWTDKQERKERESGEREIVRIKWGNVEQRIHAREDGEAWWARMQREAKDAGRNPVLYADERRNESAEEPSHV